MSIHFNASKAQCTAENWTQLNWVVQLSWVQLTSVFRCALNRQRAATKGDGCRRFSTVRNRQWPVIAAHRRFLSNDRGCINWSIHECVCTDCEEHATTANSITSRRRFNAQRETNSTFEFSSVFRCALGLRNNADECDETAVHQQDIQKILMYRITTMNTNSASTAKFVPCPTAGCYYPANLLGLSCSHCPTILKYSWWRL